MLILFCVFLIVRLNTHTYIHKKKISSFDWQWGPDQYLLFPHLKISSLKWHWSCYALSITNNIVKSRDSHQSYFCWYAVFCLPLFTSTNCSISWCMFAGKKSNKSPSAIAIVVPTVVSAVIIICIGIYIYICFFYSTVRKAREKVESKSENGLSFIVVKDIFYIITT